MAGRQRTEYELVLDDKFSKKLRGASDETRRFEGEINEAGEASDQFGDKLQDLAGIAAGVFAGLGVNELTQQLRQMGKAQSRITAVTGETAEETRRLAGRVGEVGVIMGQNEEQIIEAANAVENNLGVSFEKAIDLIQRGFETTGGMSDEMLDILREYPQIFNRMGTSAEEFFGFLTQSSRAGVFNDRAFMVVEEFQNRLGDTAEEGNEVTKALQQIGLSAPDIQNMFNTGQGLQAMQEISAAITQLDNDTQEMNIITRIFGGAGEQVGAQFFETMAQGTKSIEDFESALSPTQEAFIAMDTAMFEVKNTLAQALAPVMETVGNLFKQFDAEIMTTIKVLLVLAGTGGAIWGVVSAVTALANPVTAIIAAISALTAGLSILFERNEAFRTGVLQVWAAIKENLFPVIMDLWQTLKEEFAPILQNIFDIFKNIWPVLQVVGKFLGGAFMVAIKVLQVQFKAWAAVIEFVTALIADITNALQPVFSWIGEKVDQVKEWFTDMFPVDIVVRNIKDLLKKVAEPVANFLESIGFGNTAETLRSFVNDIGGQSAQEAGRRAFEENYATAGAQEEVQLGEASPISATTTTAAPDPVINATPTASGATTRTGSGGRRIEINIENIVENLNITGNLGESTQRIREEVARALTAAITDATILTS